jgi:AhpD family alkylhydroperoxidase
MTVEPPHYQGARTGKRSVHNDAPRIKPGSAADIGQINALIARALGAATGGGPPNFATTLGRHRRLFRRWIRFGAALMPGGVLPRSETELVILRVAHNTACEYEWQHHERLAQAAGLTAEQVRSVRQGLTEPGWTPRQRLLLRAADELHNERVMSESLWSELRPLLSDVELIELCMLIGQYEMLAMTLNTLRVAPDPLPNKSPPRWVRVSQRLLAKRSHK